MSVLVLMVIFMTPLVFPGAIAFFRIVLQKYTRVVRVEVMVHTHRFQ